MAGCAALRWGRFAFTWLDLHCLWINAPSIRVWVSELDAFFRFFVFYRGQVTFTSGIPRSFLSSIVFVLLLLWSLNTLAWTCSLRCIDTK